MGTSFLCRTCGKTHDGLPTDRGWTLPDVVWAIPESERPGRAKFNSDLCQLDDRFFIRCLLKVPFNEQPGYFGWGVWVEVAASDFHRYIELYDKDASGEPAIRGLIANEIPAYPSTLGIPVLVQFQDSNSRPAVQIPATTNHLLATDQINGLDNERYHGLIAPAG